MRKFPFTICAVLLLASYAAGQTNQSQPKGKNAAPVYRSAFLVKLTATARAETHDVLHSTALDSWIVSDKIVTYQFTIRSGGLQYASLYTPEPQPGNLPDAWWKGNALVGIRVDSKKLFIRLPDGGEIATRIVDEAAVSK